MREPRVLDECPTELPCSQRQQYQDGQYDRHFDNGEARNQFSVDHESLLDESRKS
jgi:hypothetical protein